MFGFDKMFDLNRDGHLDSFERATQFRFMEDMMKHEENDSFDEDDEEDIFDDGEEEDSFDEDDEEHIFDDGDEEDSFDEDDGEGFFDEEGLD